MIGVLDQGSVLFNLSPLWLGNILRLLVYAPNIMFEGSACQKSNHLLNYIFHNALTKK